MIKALLINTADQYDIAGISRNRQGWGIPSLRNIIAAQDATIIPASKDLEIQLDVKDEDEDLKFTLVYSDSPGSNLVRNVDLLVTSPDGHTFWGNHGLRESNDSLSGGKPDTTNNVENVFVSMPQSGIWKVAVHINEPSAFVLIASRAKESRLRTLVNQSQATKID